LTRRSNHRAVAPVIATLLLVAIAVVGGTIIFVFSQSFFSQSQISGTPTIELVKILGYDARDITNLDAHNGITMTAVGGISNQAKNVGEYVIVYVKNDSVGKILFSEVRFGGTVYNYVQTAGIPDHTLATAGTYAVMDNSTNGITQQGSIAEPGQTVGVLIDLNDNFPIGRDTQFKLTTNNGAIFVGTIVMGHEMG